MCKTSLTARLVAAGVLTFPQAQAATPSDPAMVPLAQYLSATEADEIAPARSAAPASISTHGEVLVLDAHGYKVAVKGSNGAPVFDENAPYRLMAPLDQYLMPEQPEITLARSAAPPAISAGAKVMVLGREGYTTAVQGRNGFLCIVERSWGAATDDPDFWNPKVRAPICFNPRAARTFAPIYLMKTKLVLTGKSKTEIAQTIASAFDNRNLPQLALGAMCYMMSKKQYLSDSAERWYPHLMFFVSGNAAKSWGANLPGSPVIAANDPEERATIFLVWVGHWSNGTPAPQTVH